jgi:hypothetical protein
MKSSVLLPMKEHLNFCTSTRILPSLRDLWSIVALVPGLKAWAIFGGPSGTGQKMRCSRL